VPGVPEIKTDSGVLVLDDCDPDFKGKQNYEDNLTYYDATGNVVFRISGLNICESIGSNHMIAADSDRGCIWLLENVGKQIHKYDRQGKELLVIPNVKANAIAIDPESGNLWVILSNGTIHGNKTDVYDPQGKLLLTYLVSGFDLVYDKNEKAFWFAGPKLTKIDARNGHVLFQEEITTWCASSVAVCPTTGTVWVALRQHPNVRDSKNELVAFNNHGVAKQRIELGDATPFHVSVDNQDGWVWVTLMHVGVRRYSPSGILKAVQTLPAIATESDPTTGDAWLVTTEEVIRLNPDGDMLFRKKHKSKTGQAWATAF
jgi:sugar lactone lactonase YvrE